MFIAEVFTSLQGEGGWAGVPSFFIRTSGCNLRCWFCDTPYTSWQPEGETVSVDSLVEQAARSGCEHVVITGGEPMLVPDLVELTARLHGQKQIITIETAGTVDLPVTCDLMSISPKLSNSTPQGTDWETKHNERRHRAEVIRRLTSDYGYQLKFVIDTEADVIEVDRWLEEFPHIIGDNIYLMPQGTNAVELREKMPLIDSVTQSRGWHAAPRLHIEWFGNTRGT